MRWKTVVKDFVWRPTGKRFMRPVLVVPLGDQV
jgi:hypothetical protein